MTETTPKIPYSTALYHLGIVRTVFFCLRFTVTGIIVIVLILIIIIGADSEGALTKQLEGGAEIQALYEHLYLAEQMGQDVSEQRYELYNKMLELNPWIEKLFTWPAFIAAYLSAWLYLEKLREIYAKHPNDLVQRATDETEGIFVGYALVKVGIIVGWIIFNHVFMHNVFEDPFAILLAE